MPEEHKDSEAVYDPNSLPSLLPIYYNYIFPYGPYCKWLFYGSKTGSGSLFEKREFSFTLQNDIYVRYQSFASEAEFRKELKKMNPYKIDIGAIYSAPPKHRNRVSGGSFKPLTKELVFDIDMTDYDDVRKCCQGADICKKCWTLMSIAIKILNRALKDDFGFKHLLWVYSGRRGVHCWVCDEKARSLSAHARSSIVEYLSLIQAGNHEKRVTLRDPVHPYIRNCHQVIRSYWDKYAIEDQGFLDEDKDVAKVLKLISDLDVREKVEKQFAGKNSAERWKKLRETCTSTYESDPKRNRKLRYTSHEIMMEFCFPRLDVNVSKGINHLLKSPFCVHPKTGRVCVPIDVSRVDEFDPFAVPTISDLCTQVEKSEITPNEKTETLDTEVQEAGDSSNTKKLFRKTSLQEYMKPFDSLLENLQKEAAKQNLILQSDLKGEF
uniref:DNA primase n=1 Tax=Ciona intestinalis TaxID=7719 RepID=F6YA95_CIOIN|nr:DNA primase small subunit [Ciona intestinalis]|eukprot:XP_002129877.1 DNA primase small subunit [Ciona intestinalis]